MKTTVALLLFVALGAASCARPSLQTLPVPAGCDRWEPLPMTVSLDETAAGYRDEVGHAMRTWDRALGRPAFVWSLVETAPTDVYIAAVSLPGAVHGMGPSFCHGGKFSAVVVLDVDMDTAKATAFATHELGHTLGLGHSEARASIMFPIVDASLMGDWDSQTAQTILPTDARLALALHAPAETHASGPEDAGPVATAPAIGTSPSSPPVVVVLPDLDKDPGGFLSSMLSAARSGQWRLLAAGLLIIVVAASRRYGARLVPWVATDRGGAALVLLLALLGGVATALADGAAISFGLLVNSISMALTAAGGYTLIRRVISPQDKA